MKTFILSTAIALSLVAPAVASDQLARSLGVEPGVFSTAQLVQLRAAQENDDRALVAYILSGDAAVNVAPANAAGLEAAIARFTEEGDFTQAGKLEDRGIPAGTAFASTRNVTAVPAQLRAVAAAHGIDAGSVPVGELVNLARAVEQGDQALARGIVSRLTD